jgi:hypothetical protein
VLQRNLLKQGHYDAIHVRAGGSELGLKGAKEKVKAVKHHDGYATEIPQYWVDAFRVSDGSRGLESRFTYPKGVQRVFAPSIDAVVCVHVSRDCR